MTEKNKFPTRIELDTAFHYLQDQITRIAVSEEQEMVKAEVGHSEEQNEH